MELYENMEGILMPSMTEKAWIVLNIDHPPN